jgi:hypothetical protein
MMRNGGTALVLGLCLLGLACSSDGSAVIDGPLAADAPAADAPRTPDAGVDGPQDAGSSCLQARDAWRARFAQLDTTCTDVSDCSLIGRPGAITCEATPIIGTHCEGEAARGTAIAAARSDLDQLEQTWLSACGGNPCSSEQGCVSDCGPGHAECIEGHCVTRANACPDNCLCPRIDAGT